MAKAFCTLSFSRAPSSGRYGKFGQAKKVALAMETLVRTRFPHDYFGMVGFYTKAVELTARSLPEATWSMGDPFTNLQDGLRMAGRLLQRHAGRNQQIIVITDGQPTAYYVGGQLHCEWPMAMGGVSRRAAEATAVLASAHLCRIHTGLCE